MDFKTFCEQQEVELQTVASINGEMVGKVSAYSWDSLDEQSHKLQQVIVRRLQELWDELADDTTAG